MEHLVCQAEARGDAASSKDLPFLEDDHVIMEAWIVMDHESMETTKAVHG